MVKKLNVTLLSVFAVGLTLFVTIWPGYYQQLIISSTVDLSMLRFLICACLLVYAFRPQSRTYLAQKMMRAGGVTLLLFGLITLVAPGFFGHSVTYVPVADTFIFLEGGILSLLLGLELPAHQPSHAGGKHLQYLLSLLAAQPKKLTRSTRSNANAR